MGNNNELPVSVSGSTIGAPMRLGHLPLVMGVFRNIRMGDIIDHAIGQHAKSDVSTGECVATILAGVFSGAHSLWRLRERLTPYDMRTVMQDATYDLDKFNEERLAKGLDDIYAFGTDKIMTAVAIQMIKAYDIGVDTFSFDTTSLSFFGAYEREDPWTLLPNMPPPPVVTYGHSKIRRPDLKQIMFGMLTSRDGGVPLMGKALDGNLSDSHAAAQFFGRIRELVADPSTVTCVGDSKAWCARVIAVTSKERMRLVSRLPRTRKLHATLMAEVWKPERVVEASQRPGKSADRYEIMGFDAVESFEFDEAQADGSVTQRTLKVPVRAVRVYSTALLRTKMATIDRLCSREEKAARKQILDWQDAAYACQTDAQRAADRHTSQADYSTLDITAVVVSHNGPSARGRGRPRQRPEPALAATKHWRVRYTAKPITKDQISLRLHEQASFVVIRTCHPGWEMTDTDLVMCYKGQYQIEHGFSWLKSNAEINPVFIHTPHRIAALCCVYCLGLMLWTIIQRTVRANLRTWKTGLPYHRNKPSANITTRFLFELFPSVSTVPLTTNGVTTAHLAGFTDIHDLACRAAGIPREVYKSVW